MSSPEVSIPKASRYEVSPNKKAKDRLLTEHALASALSDSWESRMLAEKATSKIAAERSFETLMNRIEYLKRELAEKIAEQKALGDDATARQRDEAQKNAEHFYWMVRAANTVLINTFPDTPEAKAVVANREAIALAKKKAKENANNVGGRSRRSKKSRKSRKTKKTRKTRRAH